MNEQSKEFMAVSAWIQQTLESEIALQDGGARCLPSSITRAYFDVLMSASPDVVSRYIRVCSRYGACLFFGTAPDGWIGSADFRFLGDFIQSALRCRKVDDLALERKERGVRKVMDNLICQRYSARQSRGVEQGEYFYQIRQGEANYVVRVTYKAKTAGCFVSVFTKEGMQRAISRGLFPVSVTDIVGFGGTEWDIAGNCEIEDLVAGLDWCMEKAGQLEAVYARQGGLNGSATA